MRKSDVLWLKEEEPLPKKRKLHKDLSYCNILVHKNTPNRTEIKEIIKENEGRAFDQFLLDFHITHLLCSEENFDLNDKTIKQCYNNNIKIVTPSFLFCDSGEEDMYTLIPIFKDITFTIILNHHDVEDISKIIKENSGIVSNKSDPDIIISTLDYLKKVKDAKQLEPLRSIIYGHKLMNCVVTPKGIKELAQKKCRIESMNIFHMIKRSEYIQNKMIINLRDWDEMEVFKIIEKRRNLRMMNCKIFPFEYTHLMMNLPLKIWGNILSFLSFKDICKLSLASKDFYSLCFTTTIWKIFCFGSIKNYKWLPKIDITFININRDHWYKFFRESIFPLIIDSKTSKTPLLALYIDLKKSNNIKRGSSKFGGQGKFYLK